MDTAGLQSTKTKQRPHLPPHLRRRRSIWAAACRARVFRMSRFRRLLLFWGLLGWGVWMHGAKLRRMVATESVVTERPVSKAVAPTTQAATTTRTISKQQPQQPPPQPPQKLPPLKIFVLSGQSNMLGNGLVDKRKRGRYANGTLGWMVESLPETYGKLATHQNPNGDFVWTERPDVYIATALQQLREKSRNTIKHSGRLTVGYGKQTNDRLRMGPELGFGWAVGDSLANTAAAEPLANGGGPPVDSVRALLVKASWGGTSLAVDFRPPSAATPEAPVGPRYHQLLWHVKHTLERLHEHVPFYTDDRGYEIAGFAWHQGWSDARHRHSLEAQEDRAREYESNLARLIRDVRKDLGVPNLPVVIGVTGMLGWRPLDHAVRRRLEEDESEEEYDEESEETASETTSERTKVSKASKTTKASKSSTKREKKPKAEPHTPAQAYGSFARVIDAQFAVARYPEFGGSVVAVETRDFYRPREASPGGELYHWHNNCESYWKIGEAMGTAMVDLLNQKPAIDARLTKRAEDAKRERASAARKAANEKTP